MNCILILGAKLVDIGDLSARFELKHRLKCNSFGWFAQHIMPDSNFKPSTFVGMLRNENHCLDYTDGKKAIVSSCHSSGGNQAFAYNYLNQIVFSGGECLCKKDVKENSENIITFCSCADELKTKWLFDQKVMS